MPRNGRRLAVFFVLLWSVLGALATAHQARASPEAIPKLSVSARFVRAGHPVTVSGAGFPSGAEVQIGFLRQNCSCDDAPKGTSRADASGRFRWQYTVPARTTPGAYVFWSWSARIGETLETPAVTVSTANPVGTSRVFVPNCGSTWYLDFQPTQWSNGCTGGALNLTDLHWSEYRDDRAEATGLADLRESCGNNPCYMAGTYKTQAKLSASQPSRCSAGTLADAAYYSQVVVEVLYRPGNPYGTRPGWISSVFTLKADGGRCYHSPP